ncbi:MFS transporter [Sphingomonas sp. TREG-RG-20F-R18-01]|uniref:MFS transporter n=1 Tax=Sphingomonas sp. TREG-RG-20F-R18-01 TaxID=2914982 RepID=UPI001F59F741|nr:MFS transporter [Sphingomonas sp. TREG-RG-20F-R18-01]
MADHLAVNAGSRLDRLPISRFHWRILALISAGAFLDAFDVYLAGGVIAALKAEGFSTLAQSAVFMSMTFLGMMIGAGMAGYIGDRFGRRASYQFNLALFGLASVAAIFSPTMTFLIVCRFVMGIGLGAELVVAAGTLGEFIPPAFRGRWVSIMGMVVNSGLLVATSIGYIVIPTLGWRYMFAIAGAAALIVWIMRKKMPESPRWLESVGRFEEAEATLTAIEREVSAQKGPLPAPAPARAIAMVHAPLKALFGPKLRNRVIAATLAAIAVNVSVYGFVAWLPTFLVSHGTGIVTSLWYTTLMSFGSVFGAVIAIGIADRISRRLSLILTAVAIMLFGFLYPNAQGDVMVPLTGFLLVSSIYTLVTLALFAYIPELFPTAYRLRGTGFAGMCGRAASMVTPYATVFLFANFGLHGVLGMVGVVLVAMIIAVGLLRVETTGQSLDEVSADELAAAGGATA